MRELPKDVLKMASGLISPSGLAGHRRQLCNVKPMAIDRMHAALLYTGYIQRFFGLNKKISFFTSHESDCGPTTAEGNLDFTLF